VGTVECQVGSWRVRLKYNIFLNKNKLISRVIISSDNRRVVEDTRSCQFAMEGSLKHLQMEVTLIMPGKFVLIFV
jgi:hypothetical protein